MSKAALALGSLLLIALSGTAHAQTDEAAARQHFRLGQAHYENGQFAEAAREFETAYQMSGRARLLYNAYLAYRDMQDLPNSARTLRQFLAESTDLEGSERDQLQARLAAIDAAIARQQTSMPAEAPSQTEAQASQEASGEPAATASATVQPSSGGGGGFNPSPVGFIVGGVGVALGIAAIITGVMASSDYSLLDSECPGGACPDRQDLRDAQSRGSTLAVLTDVFWISGVVALAAGVTLIFVLQEGGGESSTTAGAMCTSEGCYGAVQSRF